MSGLYFEDFSEGMVFEHAITRTVTEMDNVLFSTMTMNPQPLHIDAHYAAQTEFGQPLVNSLFTLGLMIGISVSETTLFQGDTLHVKTQVISIRASRSRPLAGIVEFRHSAMNQRDEEVAFCFRAALMKRRPS